MTWENNPALESARQRQQEEFLKLDSLRDQRTEQLQKQLEQSEKDKANTQKTNKIIIILTIIFVLAIVLWILIYYNIDKIKWMLYLPSKVKENKFLSENLGREQNVNKQLQKQLKEQQKEKNDILNGQQQQIEQVQISQPILTAKDLIHNPDAIHELNVIGEMKMGEVHDETELEDPTQLRLMKQDNDIEGFLFDQGNEKEFQM